MLLCPFRAVSRYERPISYASCFLAFEIFSFIRVMLKFFDHYTYLMIKKLNWIPEVVLYVLA